MYMLLLVVVFLLMIKLRTQQNKEAQAHNYTSLQHSHQLKNKNQHISKGNVSNWNSYEKKRLKLSKMVHFKKIAVTTTQSNNKAIKHKVLFNPSHAKYYLYDFPLAPI